MSSFTASVSVTRLGLLMVMSFYFGPASVDVRAVLERGVYAADGRIQAEPVRCWRNEPIKGYVRGSHQSRFRWSLMVFHPKKPHRASFSPLPVLLSIVIRLLRGWLGTTPTTDLIIPAIKKLYQSGSFFISLSFSHTQSFFIFFLHSLLELLIRFLFFLPFRASQLRESSPPRTRNSGFLTMCRDV